MSDRFTNKRCPRRRIRVLFFFFALKRRYNFRGDRSFRCVFTDFFFWQVVSSYIAPVYFSDFFPSSTGIRPFFSLRTIHGSPSKAGASGEVIAVFIPTRHREKFHTHSYVFFSFTDIYSLLFYQIKYNIRSGRHSYGYRTSY